MQLRKIVIALLAILLVATAIVPVVGAGDSAGVQPSSDSARFMNWAYRNEGKTVTAAECLQLSAPGYWANLSAEKKKVYSEITVEIPDFHSLDQGSGPVSATARQAGITSETAGTRGVIVYVATANSATSALPGAINYWAVRQTRPRYSR